jgi:hypothetical protein
MNPDSLDSIAWDNSKNLLGNTLKLFLKGFYFVVGTVAGFLFYGGILEQNNLFVLSIFMLVFGIIFVTLSKIFNFLLKLLLIFGVSAMFVAVIVMALVKAFNG